jgi:hypothetical protein
MEVLEAPQSEDTFWPNVGKTHKELQVSKLIVTVLTVVLCLLWTIPMSFISSLSSIEGLREKVKFIDEILTSSPWLVPVVAQLAPLLIVVAKVILRMLLEFLSLREGLISGAVVQASFFTKFAWFIILQTFFVSAISGSIIEELSEMLQEPQKIVDKLAETLPEQSTKFIQFLLVDSSITLGIELLRVSPVATAIIRSKLGPNLTEKESNTTWMGLRPLADPEGFRHGYVLGTCEVTNDAMPSSLIKLTLPCCRFVQQILFYISWSSLSTRQLRRLQRFSWVYASFLWQQYTGISLSTSIQPSLILVANCGPTFLL